MTNTSAFSPLMEEFLKTLRERGRSSATILAYGADLRQMVDFLGKRQAVEPKQATTELLDDFKVFLNENNYQAKSVARKLNAIKAFFAQIKSKGIIDSDPSLAVAHPKYDIKPPKILTQMEYRALRDSARDDIRMSAIIEVFLQTGLRVGELVRLTIDDIKENAINVVSYESHGDRTVSLNASAKKSIERYLKVRSESKSRALFVTKSGRGLLARNLRVGINRYFKMAGIKDGTVNALRHTFIAHQLLKGASPVVLQKTVGHKRLTTTEKYLEIVKDKMDTRVKLEEL